VIKRQCERQMGTERVRERDRQRQTETDRDRLSLTGRQKQGGAEKDPLTLNSTPQASEI
jgi:hypothetical protein